MADRTTIPCVNCDACGDIMHILPCCHKLCQSCAAGEDLKCPRCGIDATHFVTVRDHSLPCEVCVAGRPASYECCDPACATSEEPGPLSLCEECARHHSRARQTSSHKLRPLSRIPSCPSCDRSLGVDNDVLFCTTCDRVAGACCLDAFHEGHNCRPITASLATKLRRSIVVVEEDDERKLSRGRRDADEILKVAHEIYEDQDAKLTELEKEILSAVGERFKTLRKKLRLQDEKVRSDIGSVRVDLERVTEARELLYAAAAEVENLEMKEIAIAYGVVENRKKEVVKMTRKAGDLSRLLVERDLKQFLDLSSVHDLLTDIASFGDVVVWERMTLPEVQGSSPTEGDRPYAYHALQQEPNTLFHGVKQKTVGNKKISEYGGLHIKTDDDIIRCGIGPLTGQIGDTTGGSGLGQFRSPYSVCNHSGRMFVSDSLNHRVQVFDTNTLQLVYTIGQRGDGEGEFCDPSGIGVDAEGRIIVAEYGNDRVQIFDKDGKFLQCCGTFGSDEGEFYGPFGVHVCPATQNLLITDSCNHRVQVLSPRGKFLFAFGSKGSEPGQFLYPEGIGTTLDGSSVVVSDKDNGRIQVFTQRGIFIRLITTSLRSCGALRGPLGVAADAQGRLYCCDCGNSRIVCLRITGEVLWSSDGHHHEGRPNEPSSSLTFAAPTGVCIDQSGALYVACDHAIMIFGQEQRQRVR